MKSTILIVDDESRMRKLIKDFIVKEDYEVLEASDGQEAIDIFESIMNTTEKIDLIILDVMMPKVDGWNVCKYIRSNSNVPIIMLTAKSEEADELLGFELGIDEYITKPFSPRILLARIDSILRRTKGLNVNDIIEISGIRLDKKAHNCEIDGKIVNLSFKEFELLQFLMENRGFALSREKILNNVWDYDYYGDARNIDTHIKKLRSKMGEKGKCIQTMWGMGYKFEGFNE